MIFLSNISGELKRKHISVYSLLNKRSRCHKLSTRKEGDREVALLSFAITFNITNLLIYLTASGISPVLQLFAFNSTSYLDHRMVSIFKPLIISVKFLIFLNADIFWTGINSAINWQQDRGSCFLDYVMSEV
jgi:hypothetical protein